MINSTVIDWFQPWPEKALFVCRSASSVKLSSVTLKLPTPS